MSKYDYSELIGKVISVYGTRDNFAKAMRQTPTTIGKKLQGKSQWSQEDISLACDLLKIPVASIPLYFFCTVS